MLIELQPQATREDVRLIESFLETTGKYFAYRELYGSRFFVSPFIADTEPFADMPGVKRASATATEYILASRAAKSAPTVVEVAGLAIGGGDLAVMAGPCSIENESLIHSSAAYLAGCGVKILRGGAYKPRSSPYRFQGLGVEGLKMIRAAADHHGMAVVTEVLDTPLIDTVYPYTDILQIGSRNMHNYWFLKELGKIDKPVLLKRGMYATVEEWLQAAEYILLGGNENVILCERGIRTFDPQARNTLDVTSIALVKDFSHLPIIADPSHGTGRRELVAPLSLAAVAAGADGLLIEVHPQPEKALSDGLQSIYIEQLPTLLEQLAGVAHCMNKTLPLLDKHA